MSILASPQDGKNEIRNEGYKEIQQFISSPGMSET